MAGTEISDAVRVTQAVNQAGMSVSIDNLGENVTNTTKLATAHSSTPRYSTPSQPIISMPTSA